MATGMALSSVLLNVSCAPMGEKTSGMRAVLRRPGSPLEAFSAPRNLGGFFVVDRQRPAHLGIRESRRTICGKALQQESPSPLSSTIPDYIPGPLDDFFFKLFRQKMAEEVGWDSEKSGYDGLIEVVKHLYTRNASKETTEAATVRVLTSLFPAWLLPLFRRLIAPISDGKVAAVMTAFVTKATCQWLMGPCTVNEVTLADGSTLLSGVYVQKCKYLEESKCAGICTHTCKIPTQTFIKEGMGIPLAMEPNFNDFSCQFKYGVVAPPRDEDPGLQTPCLSICPIAVARSSLRSYVQLDQCPQVFSSVWNRQMMSACAPHGYNGNYSKYLLPSKEDVIPGSSTRIKFSTRSKTLGNCVGTI